MFDNQNLKPLGRTLKLFLVNGLPTGVITAELGNWNGKVLKAPRLELPDLSKREECFKTGVFVDWSMTRITFYKSRYMSVRVTM